MESECGPAKDSARSLRTMAPGRPPPGFSAGSALPWMRSTPAGRRGAQAPHTSPDGGSAPVRRYSLTAASTQRSPFPYAV
jgi:hypothetical protein